MKTSKRIFRSFAQAVLCVLISYNSFAQNEKELKEIRIKTSAQCEMCKTRLEKALAYEKGVKKATLDLTTMEMIVTYKPLKTNPGKLRTAITQTGYDADSVPAVKDAYNHLPDCCKKGAHGK